MPSSATPPIEEGIGQDEGISNALGRAMANVLRHSADKVGLRMRVDGFAKVDDMLALPMFRRYTFAEVVAAVDRDEKTRFKMISETATETETDNAVWYIRANNGHSLEGVFIDMDEILDSAKLSTIAVHGTTRRAWKSISSHGLSRMKRHHIHFLTTARADALRDSSILIFVDIPKALRSGIKFFISSNGVVLSPGDEHGLIEPKFFSRVEERRTGRIVGQYAGPRAPYVT
ncbi:phosphotransferase KptA/Tpt1 [Exidia glandulosa HHB12029]|uniref:2'-phosphotransferase n=1 Tax=Exidia glandulosa HHB12029 TaxID=1314781 RepID=A0A165H071_EXIGL|nr:phosphotransferase KptA/Tpt1 [Exidia glandulosa HHB12029]